MENWQPQGAQSLNRVYIASGQTANKLSYLRGRLQCRIDRLWEVDIIQ